MTPADFKRFRKQMGLTKVEMAGALGITLRQVQRIEAGANITGPMSLAVQHLLSQHRK